MASYFGDIDIGFFEVGNVNSSTHMWSTPFERGMGGALFKVSSLCLAGLNTLFSRSCSEKEKEKKQSICGYP